MRLITVVFVFMLLCTQCAVSQQPKFFHSGRGPVQKFIDLNVTSNARGTSRQNPETRGRRVVTDRTGKQQIIRIPSTVASVSDNARWDTTFGLPALDNNVAAIATISGDVYVGGYFTSAGGIDARYVAKWDGSKWSALGTGLDGAVRAIAVIGTDLYVGGDFTIAGDSTVNYIAKWDGSKWSSLKGGMDSIVNTLAVIGTHLYAGGAFAHAGGTPVSRAAEWDGSGWTPLGTLSGEVRSLVDSASILFAGGDFITADGNTANYIARWNGTTWSSLGGGMDNSVYALAMLGGDLYAGGAFTSADGNNANYVAKWDGIQWTAFSGGVDNYVYTLVTIGTDLYAGGDFTTADGTTVNRIARWRSSTWERLGDGVNSTVSALAVAGSVLYVGGSFAIADSLSANYIASYNGTSWASLSQSNRFGLNDIVFTTAIDSPNIYVGGAFLTGGDSIVPYLARWNGSTWNNIGGVEGFVFALLVDGSNLYVGGSFNMIGGVAAANVARWNGTGWESLGSGTNDYVDALAKIGDTLYAGGGFTSAGGNSASYIAQWNGTQWSDVSNGTLSEVYALAVLQNKLYVGGNFTAVGGGTGTGANHIAQWDGSHWSALGDGTDDYVDALAVTGNNIFAGGGFLAAGGQSASHIARWNGATWQALGAGVDNIVSSLTTIKSNVYTGGSFLTAGSTTVNYIARWDGSNWSSLGSGVNSVVYALGRLGSDLIAGGDFTTAGGKASARIARWSNPSFSVQPSTVDFSSVLLGSNKKDTLSVSNHGTWPMDIFSVSSSNPEFTLSALSSPIAPGGSANLIVTFTPGSAGLRGGDILFVHDAPGSPDTAVLSGSGATPAGFSVSPTGLNFGSVVVAHPKSDSVVVKNTGTLPLTITSATSIGAQFTVTPSSATIPGLDSLVFTITFTPTSEGSVGNSIVFVHNAAGSPDSITVSGTGIAPATFSASRSAIEFGSVLVSQQKADSVFVRNLGDLPLTINSVVSTDARFVAQPLSGTVAASESVAFRITFTPTSAGVLNGAIVFSHDGSTSSDTVHVHGTGIAPAFSISPNDTLALGSLFVGQTVHGTATITNSGTAVLVIHSVTNSDSQFVVTLASDTLAASASTGLDVSLRPTSAGFKSTTITFAHNAAGSPKTLVVTGNAVQLSVTASAGPHGGISPVGIVNVNYQDSLRFTIVPDSGYRISDVQVDSDSVGPVSSYTFYTISAAHTISASFTIITGVADRDHSGIPSTFGLSQNYPNPFNPTTIVNYDLPNRSTVVLKIYNLLGQVVAILVDGIQNAGYKSVEWNASGAASGIYIYSLEATSETDPARTFTQVRKMLLVR